MPWPRPKPSPAIPLPRLRLSPRFASQAFPLVFLAPERFRPVLPVLGLMEP